MTIDKTQLLIGGGVIFWRLAAKFSYQQLKDNLTKFGLEKYAPEVRTNESALRESLKEVTSDLEGMIRALKNPKTDGYAVVQEDVGEEANSYYQLYTAKVDEHGAITVQPHNQNTLGELYVAFGKHKGTVTNLNVAKSLVSILEHLGATALRDGGGFYWLHDDKLDQWREIAQAIEDATDQAVEEGSTKQKAESAIYLIRTQIDNLSARALKDAIIAEVRKRSEEIKEHANRPGLKQKAFASRQREAQALHDRVKYFEDLLGEGLAELHEVADVCENEVVEAAVQQLPNFFAMLGDAKIEEVQDAA
jgi:hypothetical protein